MLSSVLRFRGVMRPYRRALGLGAALTVVDVGLSLAQPWPLRTVVDGVLQPASGVAPPDAERRLALAVAALVALAALSAAVGYWSSRLLSSAGLNIGADLRTRVVDHLQRLSLSYHARHRVGDLVARATAEVDRTQDMVVQGLATLFPSLLLVIGMFGVMVALDPWFTLLAVAASLPLVLATHRSRRQLRLAARRSRHADAALASSATESLGAIHLIQAFTLEDTRRDGFEQLNRTSLRAGLDSVRLQARFGPLVDLSGVASAGLILWVGAHRVLAGQLSLGVLLVFLSYLGSLYKPVKALSKLSTVLSKGAAAAERVAAVLDTEPEIGDRPGARPRRIRGGVAFEGVSFSYGREPVLDGLSFAVAPGETVALVGPTGAGKSTVAALVPRLVEATAGRVLVDGIPVQEHQLASLRRQVAVVLQDSLLLDGTLRDNILCGRRDVRDRDVERAVRLALVDEFASRLPDGLDTVVGERGASLSGGQRQRVAVARAILRDAPIVLLDEPTSALDAASEDLLVEALENLPSDRTTLVIAHRLSTIRRADRILVLDGGRLAESGDHASLVARGGLYRQLAAYQGLVPSGLVDGRA